jgi:hypothetical protein
MEIGRLVRSTIGALRIKRPEAGRVLSAAGVAGGVVEIGQAKVMTKLMQEHTHAAIFRFQGVVTNPEVGIADSSSLSDRQSSFSYLQEI